MNNETQNRFEGSLGEEYSLFQIAIPHHDELQDTLAEQVAQYSRNHGGPLTMLEIGCGTGITTERILRACPQAHVIAIDPDAQMLIQAKVALREFQGRVEFVQGTALEVLSTVHKQVNVVASAYTLHNLMPAERSKTLSAISKVLKTGGLFVNADKYAQDDKTLHSLDLQTQLRAFDAFIRIGRDDLKKEWTEHYLEDETHPIFESVEKTELASVGFRNVKIVYRQGMEAVIVAQK